MDAQKKLTEYRARKRKQAYLDSLKSVLAFKSKPNYSRIPEENEKQLLNEYAAAIEKDIENYSLSFITVLSYIFYFILWTILYLIFIKLQFGIVFLIISALVFIYWNTRTGPKKRNEVSAYSVFNENCESIDGTLKAEQFEREIRFGAGAMH